MKINHPKRYLIGIVMTAFLVLLAGNAFGDEATASKNASRDHNDGTDNATKHDKGKYANNFLVVSPYWQVEGGASYSFVAVTHSSLSGMSSQIGVRVNAITSAGGAYAAAAEFTVVAGNTQRVFIIPTNHATINSTNQTDAVFIAGTTNFTHGHLRINPQTTHPGLRIVEGIFPQTNLGDGFRDSTMLSYWGSVIVEANTTGFAMEFIGDVNDSVSLAKSYMKHFSTTNFMGSGLNIQ